MVMQWIQRVTDNLAGAWQYFCALRRVRGKTVAEIEAFQFEQLRSLIRFAWEEIPFYRKYWEAHGFDPSKFRQLGDMSLIPCIDKEIVRANCEDMVPESYDRKRLVKITTGGTTGMPLTFYTNRAKTNGRELVHVARQFVCGYRRWLDNIVILRGLRLDDKLLERGAYGRRYLGSLGRGLLMSSFHLTEQTYPYYIAQIRREAPKFIVAYPSSLTLLCSLMKKHREAPFDGLRGAVCSSETVYDRQRTLVREVLGVEIYSFYGHSEKTVSAIPDAEHRMLFDPAYGYTEFLDEDLDTVTMAGAMAQIVTTGFQNDYMPFIRYKTSDYVQVDDDPPCGFTHVAHHIIGRAQDFVYDRLWNRRTFTCSDDIFWELEGISAYQYRQYEAGKLTLLLETTPSFDPDLAEHIRSESEKFFGDCEVEIKLVDKIERTSAGKFRYFVQSINHQDRREDKS